jgi:predicted nucleic acid-binding protein
MTDRFFVDTNVLVYRRDASQPTKQPLASRWLAALWTARAGRLSTQVLNEYYQVVTRRLRPGLSSHEAQEEIREFFAWKPVVITHLVIEQAWLVEARWGLSYWDSLIVSAAREAGCRYLLTEDLQAGQEFDGLAVINPFVRAPNEFQW